MKGGGMGKRVIKAMGTGVTIVSVFLSSEARADSGNRPPGVSNAFELTVCRTYGNSGSSLEMHHGIYIRN